MEITLTKEATLMLYRMFWQPQTLGEDKPYQTKDLMGHEDVVAIQRWLSTKVFKLADKGTAQERFDFAPFTGKIKQRYVDRLNTIVKHYEKSGNLIQNSVSYYELVSALTPGKPKELESVEEE